MIVYLDEKRRRILEWLSPINMHDKQKDTYSRRQEHTGEWLLKKKEFVDWMEGDDSNVTLWCPGNRTYFDLTSLL